MPRGYFGPSRADAAPRRPRTISSVSARRMPALREAVVALRARGYALTGFGDMSVEEVAALTGLPLDQAAMAKEREFDEPFVMEGDNAGQRRRSCGPSGEMGLAVSREASSPILRAATTRAKPSPSSRTFSKKPTAAASPSRPWATAHRSLHAGGSGRAHHRAEARRNV